MGPVRSPAVNVNVSLWPGEERRRRPSRVVVAVVGVVALATAACGDDAGSGGAGGAGARASERDWEELPGPGSGPAGARLADVGGTVVAVEVGEVRVLEGDGWSRPAEIPNGGMGAAAVAGTDDELFLPTDRVAYAPGSGTWRDLPGDRPGRAIAALWTGEAVVVLRDPIDGGTLIYDPATGERREVDPPTGRVRAATAAAGGVVAWTEDDDEQGSLWRLDTGTGRWARLPAPPFEPPEGGAGLVAEGDRLVATGFDGYEVRAAVLDLPDGAEWAPIDAPPEPDHQLCGIELHGGEAATVYMVSCSGEMAVLDGGGWRSLPPAPIDAGRGQILVTADELLVSTRDGSALARLRLP
jgi:hypothetical protein